MPAFEQFVDKGFLLKEYSNLPKGRYISLFVIRKTESETIFRTEGSGEGLVKETVSAGRVNNTPMRRVMISKRKQTAVERRTGREFLREHDLLKIPTGSKNGHLCMLNTNAPCERCIDCYLYGFAAGGGGAQKSRVLTDDSFSLGSVAQVTDKRTFNATYDDGTMRNPLDKTEASRSINEDEYVRPQTHFLDIETLKDVTLPELHFVVGNVLRSARYGAISSRLGKVNNRLVAVAFSDCEVFSKLEWTQATYDQLVQGQEDLPFPLANQAVEAAALMTARQLLDSVFSRQPVFLNGPELQAELEGVLALYQQPEKLIASLRKISDFYEEPAKGK